MNRRVLRDAITDTIARARAAAPAVAVASALMSPAALAAPGDLDPSFGDVGRAYELLQLNGLAWSVEAQGDDEVIFAGGDAYDSYYYDHYYVWGFADRLAGDGSLDPTFTGLSLTDTQFRDVAVGAAGAVVVVGSTILRSPVPERMVTTVRRVDANGVPDPTFGAAADGVVHLFSDSAWSSVASSVVLEPDGRIVVAGLREDRMFVARLLADGALDGTFADAGVFTGPENVQHVLPKIVRMPSGGYRVTRKGADCQVLALTAGGVVDDSFGASGLADLGSPSTCAAIAALADDRLLVAGERGSEGFAIRLLGNGAQDASFEASAVTEAMEKATALGVSDTGSIVVAGHAEGEAAVLVMQLQANGALDPTFGNDGTTLIDLPSDYGLWPTVHDIAMSGDRVLLAGGDRGYGQYGQPFVARLLGAGAAGGPGVLSLPPPFEVAAREQDGEAIVNVRRTGGGTGPVSVLVRTRPATWGQFAVVGEDYAVTETRLTWGDGDVGDKQLVVPLLPDAPGAPAEEYEGFEVELSDPQGAAGLGTRRARVTISPDGNPGGQLSIEYASVRNVWESIGTVRVTVSRNYYTTGNVSVTVGAAPGTAVAGVDYAGDAVTLTWADGESDQKFADFTIIDDTVVEESENFFVVLSAPTGGAILGAQSKISFNIARNDQPPPPPASSKSGGGAVGVLSLLLLGLGEMLRQVSRWAARRRRRPDAVAT